MDIKELKILLKLLNKENYRGKISEVKPNDKTTVNVTRNLCEQLFNRQYIEIEEQILKIKITNNGKDFLKKKNIIEQLNDLEVKVLESCFVSVVKPSEINLKPASKRNELIGKLLEKELIIIAEKQITQIWLTSEGEEFLAQEFLTEGIGNINLSKQLLNNYLIFIRKYFREKIKLESKSNQHSTIVDDKLTTDNNQAQPNEREILETIIKLDQELNTDNYLPIFHLRNKYKSILTRQELDNILYSLQKQNKLSMSRLVDGSKYTSEEYNAGIPQQVGGSIFYLIVK